ncbi:TonB-linked SusC/RagA family outer membrane protein [Flavobacteriaceae bacterium MAR_2010_105]|nr:TonB-linked SusC/RagA family outer membrane protein [Flavobacteriaceae bacterium MAR_2010_105]
MIYFFSKILSKNYCFINLLLRFLAQTNSNNYKMKTKFSGILTLLLAFVVQISFAQDKTISGTVSDESGLPLPGVNIIVKGTTNGTQTDFDGNYTITAKTGDVLSFTYLGLKAKEVTVGASNTINVTMQEDAAVLDEVVVTAIGISRNEKELGYNVQSVSAEAISTRPNADIVNSLSGATSGVQVVSSSGEAGASSFITIRGSASITGNNQPLFVVNGLPIISGGGNSGTGGVNTSSRTIDINPDDIASLTVLKGGAATALYGVRAANGAIIITTKSGKGLASKKIELHSSVGFDRISQTPARQKTYAQGGGGFQGSWAGGNASSWGPKISTLEYDGDTTYKWDPNGRLVPKGTGNGNPARYYDPYEFFQTGTVIDNRFSISNGGDSGDYFFSLSNREQEGIIPNNEYGRTTVRLNANTKLSDKVNFGADFSYTNSRAVQIQKGSNVSGIMLGLLRTATTFDNSAGYEFADGTQRNYRNGGGYDNPYWISNNIAFDEDVNRFQGGLNLNIKFSDMVNLSYNAGIDWYNRRYTDQFKIGSRGNPTGYYAEYSNYSNVINSDLLLTISKDITEDFDVQLTLGNNFFSTYNKFLFGDATGLEIPDYYNLNNSSNNTTSTGTSQYRTMAVFGELQLSFMDMLYLGVTGRNDWATTMPEQNESAFYPSANLGFIFTQIEGLRNGEFLSFGKLRASAARTANIAPAYQTANNFVAAGTADGWTNGVNFPFLNETGFSVSTGLGNPDLKHETQESWEVGADLKFFKNRLGIDFTYFKNVNEDLLMSVPIAPSSGFTSVFLNAASMESKGIEISLNATPIQTEDFQWDLVANFTKFTNIVTGLADGVDNIFLGGFTTPQVRAVVGEEYRSIFGEDWTRDSNGNILINDDPTDSFRDGYPFTNTAQGLVPIGNFNPDWTANITNTFKYKNIGLSFLIDVKEGGVMYNGTAFAMNFFGVHGRTENREVYYDSNGQIDFNATPAENLVVLDGVYGHVDSSGNVVSNGVQNVTPVVLDQRWFQGHGSNFGGGPSSAAMEPADWVRLRELTITYDLPKISNFITDGQIYFTGRNLWLDTPYSGIDPETNLGGATNAQGMDYFNSPGTKSYVMGVKLSF